MAEAHMGLDRATSDNLLTHAADLAARINKLRTMLELGEEAGTQGDPGGRLLYVAGERLAQASAACAPNDAAMLTTLDLLYDAQALLRGCAALHPEDARGILANAAHERVETLQQLIDVPGLWPPVQEAKEGEQDAQPPGSHAGSAENDARDYLARQAAYQTEALVRMLLEQTRRPDDMTELVVASTLVRLQDLGSVILSVLDQDHGRQLADMQEVIGGWTREDAATA